MLIIYFTIIYYEQIKDEKDLQPLIKAKESIDFFLKNIQDLITQ